MGVETGTAHDFLVAKIGVLLNQLRLETLRVHSSIHMPRVVTHGCRDCWAHGVVVAEMGVALNQLQLGALCVNGGT